MWFIAQVRAACDQACVVMNGSLAKARFWFSHRDAGPGGFDEGMSAKKYARITGASRATSSRDLIGLTHAGLLRRDGAGRSTRCWPDIGGWDA